MSTLLTRAECEEILKNFLANKRSGKLIDFALKSDTTSVGYLGEYFHLTLDFVPDNGKSVESVCLFVKTKPYQNPDMCKIIKGSGMLLKEIAIYLQLLNNLRKYLKGRLWCAKCYYGRDDLFVVQNIAELGYETIPSAFPAGFMSKQHIFAILKNLAVMHASSIAYEADSGCCIGDMLCDGKTLLREVSVKKEIGWFESGIDAIFKAALKHPGYCADSVRIELPKHLHTIYDIVNPSSKHRNVFCHRDVWGGNVFFHKQEPLKYGCVFVDYQLSRYSPPAIDVLLALYLNTMPKQRIEMMPACNAFYYECFAEALSSMGHCVDAVMTYAQFEDSIKDLELFGAVYNCIAATILRLPDGYLNKLKAQSPEEFYKYTNVERAPKLLELMDQNQVFKDYMFACIADMLELIDIQKA